ncbi:glycoside hydrolase [Labrys sp. KB_33_2]
MEVEDGSPLDFSGFLANPPLGEEARIVINGQGRLARAAAPDQPMRFLCASLAWSPDSGGFPDHEEAERYARQLKLHGYNIARFHFVDAALMFGRKQDLDFNPEILDRFHYLMAALKRNGIYWIMDGLSSSRGALGGFDDRWSLTGELKLEVQLDEKAFQHWLTFQQKLLAAVNPYTGTAPISDPALVLIIPFNENGIEFDSIVHRQDGQPAYAEMLRVPFNHWLKQRYGSTAALAKAWGDLQSQETLEATTIALPISGRERSPRMRDLQAFFVTVETASAGRMTAALRNLGFRGVIAPYNNWPTLQTSLSRQNQQAVAMNTYHDWIGTYAPGGSIQQTSSLADAALYIRVIAATRWQGRPFIVSEYDQLFWNRYRYEAGLVMPAYAALQGWDLICRHGHGPIILSYGENFPHKRQMLPYAIALDPVARAGETLAALLFRRGDVQQSHLSIPLMMRGEDDLTLSPLDREPEGLTTLALLGAIGLERQKAPSPADQAVQVPRRESDADRIATALRQSGGLNALNQTDMNRGIYQSDTGQIRLDQNALRLSVITPRTEALAFAELSGTSSLDKVTIGDATGPGLFAVSALDGLPIDASRKLLVIFATDARNTAMKFSDPNDRVIADYGRLPVLMRVASIDFSLPGHGRWRLAPIGLDGKIKSVIASGEGNLATRLTNLGPDGPTTYFVIEREP